MSVFSKRRLHSVTLSHHAACLCSKAACAYPQPTDALKSPNMTGDSAVTVSLSVLAVLNALLFVSSD